MQLFDVIKVEYVFIISHILLGFPCLIMELKGINFLPISINPQSSDSLDINFVFHAAYVWVTMRFDHDPVI